MEPVTRSYMVGRRGYDSADAKWLLKRHPDYGAYREDRVLMIGQHADPDRDVFRSLLKFTGLDIPAGSEIISATLSFRADLAGAPRIAIYGLLRDWFPSTVWTNASAGETTWNSQRHLASRWGLPGADKPSVEENYDGDADRFATPDSVFDATTIQRARFDVTRSLASQVANGKLYGWLLAETTGKADTYLTGSIDGARLEVTYRPPEDVPTGSSGDSTRAGDQRSVPGYDNDRLFPHLPGTRTSGRECELLECVYGWFGGRSRSANAPGDGK